MTQKRGIFSTLTSYIGKTNLHKNTLVSSMGWFHGLLHTPCPTKSFFVIGVSNKSEPNQNFIVLSFDTTEAVINCGFFLLSSIYCRFHGGLNDACLH